jgi:hypothetical protein
VAACGGSLGGGAVVLIENACTKYFLFRNRVSIKAFEFLKFKLVKPFPFT